MEEGKDYFLFMPKSKRGLLADYPELKKHEEFTALSNKQMIFVWCFACKGSPLFHKPMPEDKLIKEAVKAAKLKFNDPKDEQNFLSGNFPHKVRAAIEVMKAFNPVVRFRAKKVLEGAIKNIESIISVKLDDAGNSEQFYDKDGNADWSKKKAYIDSTVKATNELPKMIAQAERGYGITDDKEKIQKNIDESGFTFLEKWHSLS